MTPHDNGCAENERDNVNTRTKEMWLKDGDKILAERKVDDRAIASPPLLVSQFHLGSCHGKHPRGGSRFSTILMVRKSFGQGSQKASIRSKAKAETKLLCPESSPLFNNTGDIREDDVSPNPSHRAITQFGWAEERRAMVILYSRRTGSCHVRLMTLSF